MFATLLALAVAGTGVADGGASISNFKSGLACRSMLPGSDATGWICQPTERVLVTDQGGCNYDGEDIACTWVGFEFDYVAEKAGAKLSCVLTSSQPFHAGNPKGVTAKDISKTAYELVLPNKQGRFYNPQYFGTRLQGVDEEDLIQQTTCSAAGKEVFSFKFQVHFPVAPAGVTPD